MGRGTLWLVRERGLSKQGAGLRPSLYDSMPNQNLSPESRSFSSSAFSSVVLPLPWPDDCPVKLREIIVTSGGALGFSFEHWPDDRPLTFFDIVIDHENTFESPSDRTSECVWS